MARTETLANLRTEVRNRGEIRSVYVSDSELNTYINQSIAELYDLLCSMSPDFYLTTSDISVVANTDSYALPATFYRLRAIAYVRTSTDIISLKRMMLNERFGWPPTVGSGPETTRYRVTGSNVIFAPIPQWTGTVRLYFIAAPTKLSADGDTFDGISGWEEYVVVDALMKCWVKEESDISPLMAQKAALKARIESMAYDRDEGQTDYVRDVEDEAHWPSFLRP